MQHTEKLNQQITDVYRFNNQKIDKISDNLEDFKKVIMVQFEEVSKKNTRHSNLLKEQIDYNKEDTKRSAKPQNEFLFQNVGKLEISGNFSQKKEEPILRINESLQVEYLKKRAFNANKHIESDHSDDEEKKGRNIAPISMGMEKQLDSINPERIMTHIQTQPPSEFIPNKMNYDKDNLNNASSYSKEFAPPKTNYKGKNAFEETLTEENNKTAKIINKNRTEEAIEDVSNTFNLKEKTAKIKEDGEKSKEKINEDISYLSQNEKNKIKDVIDNLNKKVKEDEEIATNIDAFYHDFGNRQNDLYLNKLKFDNYYQIKNVNYKFKEDIEKFIETSIDDHLLSWNQETKINFDDLTCTQTEHIMELIRNIKEQTKIKCDNNQYYKIYFEKLISELKLDDYIKIEEKKSVNTSIIILIVKVNM